MSKDRSSEIEEMMRDVIDKRKTNNTSLNGDSNRIEDLLAQVNSMSASLNDYITNNVDNLKANVQAEKLNQQIDKLSQQIQQDNTVETVEVQEAVNAGRLDNDVYETVSKEVKKSVLGQNEAIDNLIVAFRRFLVVNDYKKSHKGSIIVIGPNGTGRHYTLKVLLQSMLKNQLVNDSNYTVLDCSRYTSNSQESLFFQDIFSAINAKGNVILIENFEKANPLFLRYLNEFLTTGKILLNKRYIQNNKGQLVETNGGFVQHSIDSLDAKDHYLILLTSLSQGQLMGYFGSDFFNLIPDVIHFKENNTKTIDKVLDKQIELFKADLNVNYHINCSSDKDFKEWMNQQYIPANGIDSFINTLDNVKGFIIQLFLENKIKENDNITIKYDKTLKVINNDKEYNYVILTNSEAISEIEKELDEIVGLDDVKSYIYALKDNLQAQQLRAKQGFKASEVNMHMVFTGNPGTGKTTIARLISRYMKAIGVLSKGQLIEVTRGDLVGQYVGHTAPQTMSVIKSALGGVLFIDEAYSLFRGKDDSFGLEAIDTLVKGMEDYREDLIVILAGYTQEMEEFLNANSGLKSRFPQIIEFKDYTGEQLFAIAKSIAKSKDYKLADDVQEPLTNYFIAKQANDSEKSGNGRLARNVIEDAILNASSRVLANSSEAMDVLKLEDFDFTK